MVLNTSIITTYNTHVQIYNCEYIATQMANSLFQSYYYYNYIR